MNPCHPSGTPSPQNSAMVIKARTSLTSLERLERQLRLITPSRAQGDAWEKALKGWINAGGHPELTKAWMWGEWPGKLKAGLKGDKGVDEETAPNYGMVAFRAGRAGGERGIRTLDGVAPKPHFQFAPEEGSEGLLGPTEVRCWCLEDA